MTKKRTIDAISNYLSQYPIQKVSLFGSFARNEQQKDSDIDLLIQFKETIDLFTLSTIRLDLCEITHRKVDILTEKSLSENFRKRILADLKIIFEA
jgi:uncharacterized protein